MKDKLSGLISEQKWSLVICLLRSTWKRQNVHDLAAVTFQHIRRKNNLSSQQTCFVLGPIEKQVRSSSYQTKLPLAIIWRLNLQLHQKRSFDCFLPGSSNDRRRIPVLRGVANPLSCSVSNPSRQSLWVFLNPLDGGSRTETRRFDSRCLSEMWEQQKQH